MGAGVEKVGEERCLLDPMIANASWKNCLRGGEPRRNPGRENGFRENMIFIHFNPEYLAPGFSRHPTLKDLQERKHNRSCIQDILMPTF